MWAREVQIRTWRFKYEPMDLLVRGIERGSFRSVCDSSRVIYDSLARQMRPSELTASLVVVVSEVALMLHMTQPS
jgi:hypothetical protein